MKYLIILVLLSGCAHNDNWRTQDTVMQIGVTAVLMADAITTSRIQDYPHLYENGPSKHFLGSNPSTSDTAMYFGAYMISSYLISRALPHKWRTAWQSMQIGVHGYAVKNNCDNGLC